VKEEASLMRVIIAGGTGLIGRALAANLAADDYDVVVLSRSPESAKGLPESVRLERWDASTAEGWAPLVEGAEAIVNLAGSNLSGAGFFPSRWTDEAKRLIRDSRVRAGQAIVEAVAHAEDKPRAVIQASGVGYYGPHDDEILTEDAPPGNDYLASLAAQDWEPSTAAVEDVGVRRAIIRTGAVLDAHEGALPRLLLPFRLFVGGPMGSGQQWLSWIHREDEAAAIRFLIENGSTSGPFNLTAPSPSTNADFGRTIGRAMGRPYWIPVPGFALRLAFGEVSGVVLEGQRAIPQRLQDLGFNFRFPDAQAALEDLLK
jgi:uncharacterized protein (TIGR01777 family)